MSRDKEILKALSEIDYSDASAVNITDFMTEKIGHQVELFPGVWLEVSTEPKHGKIKLQRKDLALIFECIARAARLSNE